MKRRRRPRPTPRASAECAPRTVLWAPWRATLFSTPKGEGCIFCVRSRRADRRESLVLAVTAAAVVMLNKYPYASGHLMIAPRRHVGDLDRLTRAEHAALGETLRRVAGIVRRELRPDGLNLGMNVGAAAGAGIADHLHWHVVPRWIGDTNFMSAIDSVRVMPQHLLDTYDRFLPHFAPSRRRHARGAASR